MKNSSATKHCFPIDKRILDPEFAGRVYPDELAYIKTEERKSPSQKRRWGFRPSAKQFNNGYIRYVAMYGVPKDKKSVLASMRKKKKRVVVH